MLTPYNILINENEEPKIIDFEYSKLVDTTERDLNLGIREKDISIVYGQLPRENDVWALGCILYYMVHNEYPFVLDISHDKRVSVSDQKTIYTDPKIYQEIKDIIIMILQYDFKKRPTIDEVIEATTKALSKEKWTYSMRSVYKLDDDSDISQDDNKFSNSMDVKSSNAIIWFLISSLLINIVLVGTLCYFYLNRKQVNSVTERELTTVN